MIHEKEKGLKDKGKKEKKEEITLLVFIFTLCSM